MPQGHYARDAYYFQNGGYEAWPLRALADGESGGNGVFRYGVSGFPALTSAAANYWVDVVFDVTNNVAPSVVETSPSAGLQSVSRSKAVSVTFSEGMDPSSLVFELRTAQGQVIDGTPTYDGPTRTLSFVAAAPLPPLTDLTGTLVSGRDAAGQALAGPHSWTFSTIGEPGSTPTSLWDTSAAPAGFVHDTPFELGVRFRSDVAGDVTALRCFRPPDSTRQEVGHLWGPTGTLLATAAFSSTSPSGWQQANLATAVPIAADTTYTVSYHAPDGRFPATVRGFTSAVDRAPLHAPASSPQFANGVFRNGASGFPTSTFDASNYWADVVFRVPPDVSAPVLVNTEPAPGLISVAVGAAIRATFDGPIEAASLEFSLAGPGGSPVAGAVSYEGTVATFTPSGPLASGAVHTASIRATDTSGNAMGQPAIWSFTTSVPSGATPATLWDSSAVPATTSADDNGAIELGVAFQPERGGAVTGIRFYKGAGNDGTHIGHLWDASGTLLGSTTFTSETASGWQQAMFAAPIPVAGGATYVASYYAPQGHYSYTREYFANAVARPPLTAPASANGRFKYGSGGFPTDLFVATNYWVDLIFADTSGPTVITQTPAAGATGVEEAATIAATFSEPVAPATVDLQLRDSGGASVAGAVAYDPATRTATFTPSVRLGSNTSYTVSVGGTRDLAGNAMPGPSIWSFTTGDTSVASLWPETATPAVTDSGDGGSLELGVKFDVAVAGVIEGVRFYKSAANTGAHVGRLYRADGTVLASVTFASETAAGWQFAPFSTPIPVVPGELYVASYHAPSGHYAIDSWYFNADRVAGPVRAPSSGAVNGNGVYAYGPGGTIPTNSYAAANYWVDVRFRRDG
jgi:hypothetical protein